MDILEIRFGFCVIYFLSNRNAKYVYENFNL